MGMQVVNGALVTCAMAEVPVPMPLIVLPVSGVLAGEMPAATIEDAVPLVNIPSFGMCKSPLNPTVIAATAAALGAPMPGACIPVTEAWMPGSPIVMIGGVPALTEECTCICDYGGEISITFPGQAIVETA
jgi:hypothetical protein